MGLRKEKYMFQEKYKVLKREYEEKLNKYHEKEVQLNGVVDVLKTEIQKNEEKQFDKEENVQELKKKLDQALTSERNLRDIVAILESRISEDKANGFGRHTASFSLTRS